MITEVYIWDVWGGELRSPVPVEHSCPDSCSIGIMRWHCSRCEEEFGVISTVMKHESECGGPMKKYLYCAACKVIVSKEYPPPVYWDRIIHLREEWRKSEEPIF
jgi:hypothetical protein